MWAGYRHGNAVATGNAIGIGYATGSGTPAGSGTPSRAAAPTPPNCRDARSRLSSARGVDPALRASVYDNLSALSQAQGNLDDASSLAIAAVSAAEGLGTPDPLWRSYFRAGRALRAQGLEPLAIFFGKKAIAQIERQRQYFSGEDQRFDRGFLHDKIDVYRTVADWLLEAGRFDEGLEVFSCSSSRSCTTSLPGTQPGALLKAARHSMTRERELNDRYSGGSPTDDALGTRDRPA